MGDDTEVPSHDEVSAAFDARSLSLDAVLRGDETALGHAVRRVVRDLSLPSEQYTAHGQTVNT